MTRRDGIGAAVVLGWLALMLAFRAALVEPRAWGAACALAAPPLECAPRAALLWLQYQGLWGGAALALGVLGLLSGRFSPAVAAVACGVVGVVNYNASFGMLGAALGVWTWLRLFGAHASPRSAATAGRQG